MNIKILAAPIAAGLLFAASSFAPGTAKAEDSKYQPIDTGIKLCFSTKQKDIALLTNLSFVEAAIVIYDADTNKEVVKANTLYGQKGVGSYWTSKLPRNIDLDSGCYTFYMMTKSVPPDTNWYWVCARANIGPGLVSANGEKSVTLTGTLGGRTIAHAIIFPQIPKQAPVTNTLCPGG